MNRLIAAACAVVVALSGACLAAEEAAVTVRPDVVTVPTDIATYVSIDVDEAPVQDVFDELMSQCPMPARVVVPKDHAGKRITMHRQDAEFNDVLIDLCQAISMQPQHWPRHADYTLTALPAATTPSNPGQRWIFGPRSHSGPTMGVLDTIKVNKQRYLASAVRGQPHMTVQAAIVVEPQVCIYRATPFFTEESFVGEDGRKIQLPADTRENCWGIPATRIAFVANGAMPDDFRYISKMTLPLDLRMVSKYRVIEVNAAMLSQRQVVESDGMKITIEPPVDRRSEVEYVVCVARTGAGGDDELILNGTMMAAYNQADQLMRTNWMNWDMDSGAARIVYRFGQFAGEDAGGPPARLLIYVPLESAKARAEYQFQDIPLDGREMKKR